jgi:hypothetical protein
MDLEARTTGSPTFVQPKPGFGVCIAKTDSTTETQSIFIEVSTVTTTTAQAVAVTTDTFSPALMGLRKMQTVVGGKFEEFTKAAGL